MRVRGAAAILAAAVVVAVGAVLVPPVGAINRGDAVSVVPAKGSQLAGKAKWFLLKAKPGQVITQSVTVLNPNRQADTINLEPVDGTTNDETGAAYGAPGSPKASTARWISVSSPQLTLQPGESRDVAFTVRVPPNLGPGQYLAGISASVPVDPSKKPKAKAGDAGFNLALEMQRVVAVEVDIPGAWAPSLVVTGADPKATPRGIALGVHIANQGNSFAHGTGVIRIASTKTDYSFKVDTFVSKTSIVYPMDWTKDVVPGVHNIQVDINYEGGRHTTWNGSVNIAGSLRQQLENGLSSVTVKNGSSFPVWLVFAAIAGIALIAGAIYMRRRGRRPPAVKIRHA
jgi:hypothetical protein